MFPTTVAVKGRAKLVQTLASRVGEACNLQIAISLRDASLGQRVFLLLLGKGRGQGQVLVSERERGRKIERERERKRERERERE